MAWTAPPVFTVGEVFTAAAANILSTDLAFLYAGPTASFVAGTAHTTSTSFATLTGPSVTVTTGAHAIVLLSAAATASAPTLIPTMGFAISGATTLAAGSATRTIGQTTSASTRGGHYAGFWRVTLTAGTNVFTAKYKTNSGTAKFTGRSLIVWPLA